MFLPRTNFSINFKILAKGFSLLEILVVITIIGILSGLGLSFSESIQKNTRDTQRISDLSVLQSVLQQYYADQNKYPNGLGAELASGLALTNCSGRVGCIVTKTYLTQTPKDPNGSAYYFRPVFNVSSPSSDYCRIESGVEVGTCHYYYLCAKLENGTSGTCVVDATYNYQKTPL